MSEPIGLLEHGGEAALRADVPPHLHDGLTYYVLHGVATGSFLRAVLENDLLEALGRMHPFDGEGLRRTCYWLYNYAPSECWGSKEKVAAWLERAARIKEAEARKA